MIEALWLQLLWQPHNNGSLEPRSFCADARVFAATVPALAIETVVAVCNRTEQLTVALLKANQRAHFNQFILNYRTNDNLRQKETTEMVWSRVKEGRGGYHQEDVKHASAGKEKKREAKEDMTGQHQGGHERVQNDERRGKESKCVAHEDKDRRYSIGEGEMHN